MRKFKHLLLSRLPLIRDHLLPILFLSISTLILSGCVAVAAAGAGAAGGYALNQHYEIKKRDDVN